MVKDWGLKITKPGQNTTTTDPRNMLFSSAHQMFKYHQDSSTSIVLTPGSFSATSSVTHGLGYVPAFISYSLWDSKMSIIPSLPYGIGIGAWVSSWADNNKVYFKIYYGGNFYIPYAWNQVNPSAANLFENYAGDSDDYVWIGKPSGGTRAEGAIRFTNIITTGTITAATLRLKVAGGAGSGRIKWDTYGMDEDNTATWTSTSPMGRTKTSASVNRDISASSEAGVGDIVEINVLSIVNEIKARGGWSSGNAMGFMFIENGSTNDNYFNTGFWNYEDQELDILISGNLTTYYRTIVFKDQIAS